MTAGNSENHDRTVVDVKLFKAIGLFQTLSGDDGRRYRTAMRVFFWTMFGTIVLNVWGMYLSSNDFQRFTFLFLCVTISLMCSLKAHLLSRTVDAERLGVVLDLARYAFTSCGRRDPSRLSRCRAKLSALLRTSVTIQLCVMLVWLLAPFFVHTRLSVTHLDGTVSEYRIGMVNLWVPLPDVVYDSAAGWSVVYAYEAFFFFCNFIAWMQFDCYLVTTCFALNAQFCTLAAGYEALGRRKASKICGEFRTVRQQLDRNGFEIQKDRVVGDEHELLLQARREADTDLHRKFGNADQSEYRPSPPYRRPYRRN
ncbi:Hypothetical protein CINCED_3A014049 [Cinara cedri]|uniref:Olfactory receptor, insect n=1 Tax=Cinara cedri TaxID=506608 RepID=A0A5E4NBB9_9HEMI|nr:Hypothetical protein CINCED_3A014049 [Cinara cedri]